MAIAGTGFNWVFVTGGVWTRLWQGPIINFFPLQGLEIGSTSLGTLPTVSWTLDGYSAAWPFYDRMLGTTTPNRVHNPPILHYSWNAAILSFLVSPWAEFNILTNRSCWAHIGMF